MEISREAKLTIEGMAKQKLSSEMDEPENADFHGGYDEMVKHARKLNNLLSYFMSDECLR